MSERYDQSARETRSESLGRGVRDTEPENDDDETGVRSLGPQPDPRVSTRPRVRSDRGIDSPDQSGDSAGLGWNDTDSPGDLDAQVQADLAADDAVRDGATLGDMEPAIPLPASTPVGDDDGLDISETTKRESRAGVGQDAGAGLGGESTQADLGDQG